MQLLLDRRGDEVKITESGIAQIAESFDKDTMMLLLDRKGDEVKITDKVVEAAARNTGSGEEVLRLLREQRGANIDITKLPGFERLTNTLSRWCFGSRWHYISENRGPH